jgi:lipoyl(octanoyl) transferase
MVGAVPRTARGRLRSIAPTSETLFARLQVYHDINSRSAALNMAIDEALLESATAPTVRFYRWDHPALSFGYFGKLSDVENGFGNRDIVRRWTGGGIVLHGEDLTYSMVVPASDAAFADSPMSIYEKVHQAIRAALGTNGIIVAALCERRAEKDSAVVDRGYNKDLCFANAVPADVMLNGRKIAGAAQRRTRRGLLQQGSIQSVDLREDFEKNFAAELSDGCKEKTLNGHILERARELADQKYGTAAWLRRR